mmetsp:Transcript_10561/g.15996  ORF Transcript_10561/g.15996 Transcript_10561/m.15996 type:complete len:322 (+) Transcript_10561:215-1180(+)
MIEVLVVLEAEEKVEVEGEVLLEMIKGIIRAMTDMEEEAAVEDLKINLVLDTETHMAVVVVADTWTGVETTKRVMDMDAIVMAMVMVMMDTTATDTTATATAKMIEITVIVGMHMNTDMGMDVVVVAVSSHLGATMTEIATSNDMGKEMIEIGMDTVNLAEEAAAGVNVTRILAIVTTTGEMIVMAEEVEAAMAAEAEMEDDTTRNPREEMMIEEVDLAATEAEAVAVIMDALLATDGVRIGPVVLPHKGNIQIQMSDLPIEMAAVALATAAAEEEEEEVISLPEVAEEIRIQRVVNSVGSQSPLISAPQKRMPILCALRS